MRLKEEHYNLIGCLLEIVTDNYTICAHARAQQSLLSISCTEGDLDNVNIKESGDQTSQSLKVGAPLPFAKAAQFTYIQAVI